MSAIHNRQPVVLEPREYAEWLEESERPPLHLLRILSDKDLMISKIEAAPKVKATKTDVPPTMQSGFLFD